MVFSSSEFEFSTFPVGVGWVSSPGNKANLAKLELGARLCFAICNFIFYGQYKNCETHCRGEKFTIFLQVITGPNMVLTWS